MRAWASSANDELLTPWCSDMPASWSHPEICTSHGAWVPPLESLEVPGYEVSIRIVKGSLGDSVKQSKLRPELEMSPRSLWRSSAPTHQWFLGAIKKYPFSGSIPRGSDVMRAQALVWFKNSPGDFDLNLSAKTEGWVAYPVLKKMPCTGDIQHEGGSIGFDLKL